MIKSKELRKGNIIKCKVHLPIGFNQNKIYHSSILELRSDCVETNEGFYKYKDIDPMPLTEDILIRNGAEKRNDNELLFHSNDSDLPDLVLVKEEDKFYFGVEGNKYSVAIESVHHFQNLYFAIKGRDIDIEID